MRLRPLKSRMLEGFANRFKKLSPQSAFNSIISREEIAAGGTALIYRVTYSTGSREIEKILLPKFQSKPEYERLQKTEFEILERLHHPLIVRPLRIRSEPAFENTTTFVSSFEWIDGIPLSQFHPFLQTLTDEERVIWAQEVLIQVSSVLNYLSVNAIVHGDIAPDNILVQPNGYVKLIDFGVARKMGTPAHRMRVVGRFHFRAPELKASGETSSEGDIYALGKIYEDLLGEKLSQLPAERKMLEVLTIDRRLPKLKWPEEGWFSGLRPLPQSSFFIQKVMIREKTKLIPKKSKWEQYRKQLMFFALPLFLAFLSSWLPQEATISVNSWPYSSFSIDRLNRDIRFETPVMSLQIPSGEIEIEFRIPQLNNRRVIRRIRTLPGEYVKVFEDFQNIDTFKE